MAKTINVEEPKELSPQKRAAQLTAAAELLLPYFMSIDPQWEQQTKIAMSENHLTALKLIGGCFDYVMTHGFHMVIASHKAFEPGHIPQGQKSECEWCGEEFKVQWPGMRGHEKCADAAMRPAPVRAIESESPTPFEDFSDES